MQKTHRPSSFLNRDSTIKHAIFCWSAVRRGELTILGVKSALSSVVYQSATRLGVNHRGQGEDPRHRIWSRDVNANYPPDFQRNTAHDLPKHAISSAKIYFFF